MIRHLDVLAQRLLDNGIAIESITANGVVQPANLQAAAQPIIDAFDDSLAAAQAREQAAKEAAEPDMVVIRDQAQNAIDANGTFLGLGSPTNAQVLAQVRALTQQNNRIIKALVRLIARTL